MGMFASNVVVGTSLIMSVAWIVMVSLPTGWQEKSTLVWNFRPGLYSVTVERSIGAHGVNAVAYLGDSMVSKVRGKTSAGLQKTLQAVEPGSHSIRHYRDIFCNLAAVPLANQNCGPWDHLLIASWLMLLCTVVTVILLWTGAGFYYYYWHESARAVSRKWATGLLIVAPTLQLFGLAGYTALTFSFGRWLTEQLPISSGQSTYGGAYIGSCLLWLFTWVPSLIMCTCGGKSDSEELEEEAAWQRKQDFEAAIGYGGCEGQGFSPDPYAQVDPYGQQISPPQYAQQGYPQDAYSQQQAPYAQSPQYQGAQYQHQQQAGAGQYYQHQQY